MSDSSTLDALNGALADHYVFERELGQGGMATVYLAMDIRHQRNVAIKVLRPELAAVIGAERFVREIRTIATLQHPHILGLIDSGEVHGTAYYVMPFVEGESLRDRLSREKQLPVDEAVRLATEVASALDYAHRHGIIHRDIKPENILLHDGSALVADFGIALAVSTAGTRMTETGMSLGTPHYMSPEQAMGERELSPRSDVYALGCVLYEMLIGEPPFTGPTAQAIVARVVTDAPRAIAIQRKSVPAHVEAAIMKALEKLPADRYGTARELAEALTGKTAVAAPVQAAIPVAARRTAPMVWAAIVGGVIAGVAAYAVVSSIRRVALPIEWSGDLLGGTQTASGPRVSPDGQTIAFEAMVDGQTQIAVLKPSSGDWAVLTSERTRGLAQELAWSRDGARIYYTRFHEVPRGVWSISPLGGDPRLVLEDAANPDPLADGSILVTRVNAARRLQLFRFWPEKNRLDTLDATTTFVWNGSRFRAFPDGGRVVYLGRPATDTSGGDQLRIFDLTTGRSRTLLRDPGLPLPPGFAFSPDGKWVVFPRRAGNLLEYFALAADGSGRERHLYSAIAGTQWGPDIGPDGTLYITASTRLLEVHRFKPPAGRLDREIVGDGTNQIMALPDGRVLTPVVSGGKSRIMVVGGAGGDHPFVATDEANGGPMAVLGSEFVVFQILKNEQPVEMAIASIRTGRIANRFPVTNVTVVGGSPDGKTIFFSKDAQIYRLPVAGGQPQHLTSGFGLAVDPHGRYLVAQRVDDAGIHLFRVPLDGGKEEAVPLRGDLRLAPTGIQPGAVAPDGRIAVNVVSAASWFWPAAILDPTTGKMDLTPSGLAYDMGPSWAADGSIVSAASPLESHMWRLKPMGGREWWK